MRKRGLNQRYEAHGLLRKTIGEKSPPYAQSPANGIYLPILKVFIRHTSAKVWWINLADESVSSGQAGQANYRNMLARLLFADTTSPHHRPKVSHPSTTVRIRLTGLGD
jgi:hypothetical protein